MTDKDDKSLALILGAVLGVAAAVFATRHLQDRPRDIEAIFNQARETVRKLDDAVESLRKSPA